VAVERTAARRRHRDTHAQSRIGISTADCGPVLLADPEARVIGAAHAGWRGALTGVIDSIIAADDHGPAEAKIRPRLAPMFLHRGDVVRSRRSMLPASRHVRRR